MKIIERGKSLEEDAHRVTCRECGTVFEFAEQEATLVPDQRNGDYFQVKCPVCEASVIKKR